MRLIRQLALLLSTLSPLMAGDIQFEIRDLTAPMGVKLIASGVKNQTPKDVREIRVPGVPQTTHFIPLAEGFALKINTPDKNPFDGFGFSGWCTAGLFSWEWFDREQGTTFRKLQEGGSLRVETMVEGGSMKITSIEVLSDVSLRLEVSGSDKISYRILIKKGSVVTLASPPKA